MKIVIVGYGKVGQKVVRLCQQKKYKIKAIVSPNNLNATHKNLRDVHLNKEDVIIDFSHYGSVLDHTKIVALNGCNIVMGTAGWHDEEAEIKKIVEKSNIGFVYAHNFLTSANNFWEIVNLTANKIKNEENEYKCWVTEKLVYWASRSYSSTAYHTTEIIAEALNKKASRKNSQETPLKNSIFLESIPNGKNPLDITAHFKSNKDHFQLNFTVTDKEKSNFAYAESALKAAIWLQNKKGFFEYSFSL